MSKRIIKNQTNRKHAILISDSLLWWSAQNIVVATRKSRNYKTVIFQEIEKLHNLNKTGRKKMIFVKEIILIITYYLSLVLG